MDYLKRHIIVYTQWDEEQEREVIDYISLSQQAEEFRRSATVSLGSKDNSTTSKRSVVKARANKLRPETRNIDDESIMIDHNLSFPQTENSIQPVNRSANFYSLEQLPADQNFNGLARQTVAINKQVFDVILKGKNEQSNRSRIPLPRGAEDAEFVKIEIIDPARQRAVAQLSLGILACHKLLSLDSSKDKNLRNSNSLSIQQIMQGQASKHDQSQLDALKTNCKYSKNKHTWDNILKHVTF